jgi:hypothetical protein
MDAQILIVSAIILAAVIYGGLMIWKKVKSFSPKDASCGANCGCGSGSKTSEILTEI